MGNLGALASKPVMEGKAVYLRFADMIQLISGVIQITQMKSLIVLKILRQVLVVLTLKILQHQIVSLLRKN